MASAFALLISLLPTAGSIEQQYTIQIAAALSGCRGERIAANLMPYDQRDLKPRPAAQPRSLAEALCLAQAMRGTDERPADE